MSGERRVLLSASYGGGFEFSEDFEHYLAKKQLSMDRSDPQVIDAYLDWNQQLGLQVRHVQITRNHFTPRVLRESQPLVVCHIPDDPYKWYDWSVSEYDGLETLHLLFPWERLARDLMTTQTNTGVSALVDAIIRGDVELPPESF
jgi:hypothetical protein